ncbi:MAG: aldo/keto reductase [Gluconacetobacter diazotrophicus]|nr:aldo/keto reductase [Gluconacetobacter diazotrophicus]
MELRRCGRSGIRLPAIALGLWQNFGGGDAEETGRTLLRRALELGVVHIDLANNYGPPPGAAEEMFGRALRRDLGSHRDALLIATKAGYPMWSGPYGDRGSRKSILASLDASLKRMGLDRVDIFYHHRPDPETPLEETMAALAEAVRSGRALHVGLSNYPAAETRLAAAILRGLGVPCLIHQARYSMLDRWVERDGLLDALDEAGIGCIAFSPLAQGRLTGQYRDGAIPSGSRAARGSRGGSMGRDGVTAEVVRTVDRLRPVARRAGIPLPHLALRWVLRDRRVCAALVGARTVAQLEDAVAASRGPPLEPAVLAEIEAALA